MLGRGEREVGVGGGREPFWLKLFLAQTVHCSRVSRVFVLCANLVSVRRSMPRKGWTQIEGLDTDDQG